MIGIIGGTGVYDSSLLKKEEKLKLHTPYGSPSDLITLGKYLGKKVAFLPRHGNNHTIPPHKINWKANIQAFKDLGATKIIATAATGSLKENYKPGEIVIVDQFIDLSKNVHTFYDEGQFYHVSLADPFCRKTNSMIIEEGKKLGIELKEKGTYIRIEGPQFSTRAASNMYRQYADIIGMTGVPEAILAREKEICYSMIATITDYDVWADKPVNADEVVNRMKENLSKTKEILKKIIPRIEENDSCSCKKALEGAKI